MHLSRVLFTALIVAMADPALADSGISGAYVARAVNASVFIELVETDRGHLAGRYEQVVILPSGKLDDMNASITGAINGTSVTVAIKPDGFLTTPFSASGTYQGSTLSLSSGAMPGTLHVILDRGDEAEFRQQVAALTSKAAQINAARARQQAAERKAEDEAKTVRRLNSVTQKMREFVAKSAALPSTFPEFEQRFEAITARMQYGLNRERAIWGGGQASLARVQISLVIGNLSLESDSLHMEFDNLNRPFLLAASSIKHDWAEVLPLCERAPTNGSALPDGTEAACLGAIAAHKDLELHLAVLREGYLKAHGVWARERQTENAIQEAASAAVQ